MQTKEVFEIGTQGEAQPLLKPVAPFLQYPLPHRVPYTKAKQDETGKARNAM
jgi:hypothetical protein